LKIADPDEYFVVCIDACNGGFGGILIQNEYVICYEPRNLKELERNYDLELVAIVHALKMCRHYLMGRKFELRIEHSAQKHLFRKPTLNSKKTRRIEFINDRI